jgi:hypothetical protein
VVAFSLSEEVKPVDGGKYSSSHLIILTDYLIKKS